MKTPSLSAPSAAMVAPDAQPQDRRITAQPHNPKIGGLLHNVGRGGNSATLLSVPQKLLGRLMRSQEWVLRRPMLATIDKSEPHRSQLRTASFCAKPKIR